MSDIKEKDDLLHCAREVLDTEIEGLQCVREHLSVSFADALLLLYGCTGRVVLCGLGKSGLVARKIAATLSSTGTPAFFLHPVEGAHGDLGMLRPEDLLLAVSNSGETDELNVLLPSLRTLGLKLVALTASADSTLGSLADVVIPCRVPREACPYDLAPTASTTAALALGDALAVCLMRMKSFREADYQRVHPGGNLGRRLRTRVSELMHTDGIPQASEDVSICQALEILDDGGLGALLLTGPENTLAGILTDGDVRRLLTRGNYDPQQPVSACMTRNPIVARPEQSVAELIDAMEAKAITVLPVVDAKRAVLGIVHLHDLLGKGHLRFTLVGGEH